MIYLDYASTTPVDKEVLEILLHTEQNFIGSAFSNHYKGREIHSKLEDVSSQFRTLLKTSPNTTIIYTSGASESNNLAIKGIAETYKYKGKHILSTCLEHPSVSGTLSFLHEKGFEIELLKIQPNGQIDLKHLKSSIRPDTILMCISLVDSELGVIQPLEEIAKILKNTGCKLHLDAAQAIGKIPIEDYAISQYADTISISPHKFYGLCGCGLLLKREDVVLAPLFHGGGNIYRAGTPALGLIVSSLKALELTTTHFAQRLEHVKNLHTYLVEFLTKEPTIQINSPPINDNGVPFIINLSVIGFKGVEFQAELDKRKICVSVKSACSTDSAPSRAVMAVSNNRKNALNSWRISLSHLTTLQEIQEFLKVFKEILNR